MSEEEDAYIVAGRLNTHEAVCALRYQNLLERMARMERIIYAVGAAICMTFLGLIAAVLLDRIHLQPSDTIVHAPPTISR